MARFRDIKTLQKCAAAHASIHNHFQPGTSSLQSRELQTQSLRRLGRVASTCNLSVLDCWLYWSDQVSLTMPPGAQANPESLLHITQIKH